LFNQPQIPTISSPNNNEVSYQTHPLDVQEINLRSMKVLHDPSTPNQVEEEENDKGDNVIQQLISPQPPPYNERLIIENNIIKYKMNSPL